MILQVTHFVMRKLKPFTGDLIKIVHECKDASSLYVASM